jgi:hypothetical protein
MIVGFNLLNSSEHTTSQSQPAAIPHDFDDVFIYDWA